MFTPIVAPDFKLTAHLLDNERIGRALLDASFGLRYMLSLSVPDWCLKPSSVQMLDLWRDQNGKFHTPSLIKYMRDVDHVYFKRSKRHCVAYWRLRNLHPPWSPADGLLQWRPSMHRSHLHRVVSKDPTFLAPTARLLGLELDDPIQPYYKVEIEYGTLTQGG